MTGLKRPVPKLILASGSSARRTLLVAAGLNFTVKPADIDEGTVKREASASDADAASTKTLAAAILAQQQPDGAWAQHGGVAADAYATGQALYVLAKSGVAPADPAYQRGIGYLLATQNANGAWRVTSRAPKFQAFFNSGFPYGGDQWISAWATGWATMALAQAVPAH